MGPLSRILAGVDSSAAAQAAFNSALELGRAHGAELTVVHVVSGDQFSGPDARARVELMANLRATAQSSGVPVIVNVRYGDPADVIERHARATCPDMIVLGTRPRARLDRPRGGSVAERVMLRAAQPVLMVPSERTTDGPRPFERILVAVDRVGASMRILEYALTLARRANGLVTALHVVPGYASMRSGSVDDQNLRAEQAMQRLQDALPRGDASVPPVRARVVSGDPPAEIARIAAEGDADLIVIGVSRRGAIARQVFGVTAARVVRIAGQAILAVPSPRHERRSPQVPAIAGVRGLRSLTTRVFDRATGRR